MQDYTPITANVPRELSDLERKAKILQNQVSLEIAEDWEEFVKTIKNFRNHIWWGGVAVTGAGLFTLVYSVFKIPEDDKFIPVAIAGGVTTLLGVGIVVDQTAHLSYQ